MNVELYAASIVGLRVTAALCEARTGRVLYVSPSCDEFEPAIADARWYADSRRWNIVNEVIQ